MKEEEHTEQSLLNGTLRELMRNNEDYFFFKDAKLVYHGGSEAFARMAGLASAAELSGKTDLDIFPAEIAKKYRRDDIQVLESGSPINGLAERLPDENGRERWVKTWKYPVHDECGRVIGLYGIGRDISGEVILQEQVKSAEDYIDLLSHIPGGASIFHIREGHAYLDYANEGCLSIHHIKQTDPNRLIGVRTITMVFEADRPAVMAEFERILENPGATGNINYRTVGDDGKLHWVGLRFRTAYEKDGSTYYYAAYTGMDRQKAMEESLAESRNALKEAMLNTDLQFFTYYPGQGRCENLMLNDRFSQLPTVWKQYPDDFLNYTKVSPSDAEAYREMIRAIDRGEDHAECTVRFAYSGGFIWEKIKVTAVRNSEGKTVRAQGYSVNVTDKINAEERIRKERLRLDSRENGVFESYSFNLTKGSAPEIRTSDRETLFRTAAKIPDEGDRERFLSMCSADAVSAAIHEGHFFKVLRYRRQVNDEIRWVSTSVEVLPDPESGDMIAFFYTSDVNDKVIREKVSESIVHRDYACVSILSLQTGVYNVLSGTDEYLRPLDGMQFSDALVKAENEFVAECDLEQYKRELALTSITTALENKRLYSVYNRRRQVAGQLPGKPLRRMKNDIFYLDEHRDVLVFLLTDVTEIYEQERETREKLEAALIAAKQASSAKSNFLSRMSHEIRTPLNGIIGMDAIAAQSVDNPEKVADCVAKIGLSARYLLSLINDILDMSRIESGKMLLKNEKFMFRDLVSSIDMMISNQTKSKGLHYECTVSGGIAEAYYGDVMKLQQVLLNILGNAVKFTKTGKVTLDIRPVSQKGEQSVIRFTVRDTGIGIREDHLEKIFSPFEQEDTTTTTVFGGTGLGLAITKNLAELMGGSVRVRSTVGVGSEFTVDVPLKEDTEAQPSSGREFQCAREPEAADPPETRSYDFSGRRVLVAEDNLINSEITRTLLEEKNFTVETAANGMQAIELFLKHPAGYYDVILMDIRMPVMDGLQATVNIRHCDRPDAKIVPVIAMTANAFDEDVEKSRAAGMNAHLSKPIDPEYMYSVINDVLDHSGNAAISS
ncbi:MAG: ATP-binding protein [Lachnospiraceae bacterium]|nr:ATP-binding protein [Lachnospiraceae bacterium]